MRARAPGTRASLAAVVLVAAVASTVVADDADRIGQVRFPTSCSAAVQKPFERGGALRHSFWSLEAAQAFTAGSQGDPDCALASWGRGCFLRGAACGGGGASRRSAIALGKAERNP